MSLAIARPPRTTSGAPPVDRGGSGGGGGSPWVDLLTAANDIEAHLLAGRLGEAGVEVQVVKDRSAPGAWLYGGANPWAPVLVMVRRLQLEDARIVLAEISFDGLPAARPEEPGPGRTWKTPLLWWSLALGLGLLMTGVALGRTEAALHRCDLPLVCSGPMGER